MSTDVTDREESKREIRNSIEERAGREGRMCKITY